MAKKFPLNPAHPERICWGCDRNCSVEALGCGNGADRTMHPTEVWGEDWHAFDTLNTDNSPQQVSEPPAA